MSKTKQNTKYGMPYFKTERTSEETAPLELKCQLFSVTHTNSSELPRNSKNDMGTCKIITKNNQERLTPKTKAKKTTKKHILEKVWSSA